VKKYNPKAVFSIYFSVVRMEKVAKSGYNKTGQRVLNFFLKIHYILGKISVVSDKMLNRIVA
uniref:hypothetical protein n=1 Tax=Oscillospiraceae TaxID=216572 RepID=UPI001A9AB007